MFALLNMFACMCLGDRVFDRLEEPLETLRQYSMDNEAYFKSLGDSKSLVPAVGSNHCGNIRGPSVPGWYYQLLGAVYRKYQLACDFIDKMRTTVDEDTTALTEWLVSNRTDVNSANAAQFDVGSCFAQNRHYVTPSDGFPRPELWLRINITSLRHSDLRAKFAVDDGSEERSPCAVLASDLITFITDDTQTILPVPRRVSKYRRCAWALAYQINSRCAKMHSSVLDLIKRKEFSRIEMVISAAAELKKVSAEYYGLLLKLLNDDMQLIERLNYALFIQQREEFDRAVSEAKLPMGYADYDQ
ncbi:hypothetical protein PAPHI01_2069 [Pancytospora philotis]|nr:hypothetical protein PAPHI01_2069 [Pancytospora philotis]